MNELREKGLGLAVISYDPPEVISAFAQQQHITYPILSDVGSVTIRKFGILNPVPEWALGPQKDDPAVQAEIRKYVSVVRPNARMVGIAFPGTFILDRRGRVTSRFFEDFYIERNTASSLLLKLSDKPDRSVLGTKISTSHLEITTYPSDSAVAPGDRFSVALDVTPHSTIHVYAPGAQSYRVITVAIEPNHAVRVLPLRYPASEIYFFKPLKERVPVFQKPFRLVQELVLEGTPQAQAALRGKENVTVTARSSTRHVTTKLASIQCRFLFPGRSISDSWCFNVPLELSSRFELCRRVDSSPSLRIPARITHRGNGFAPTCEARVPRTRELMAFSEAESDAA